LGALVPLCPSEDAKRCEMLSHDDHHYTRPSDIFPRDGVVPTTLPPTGRLTVTCKSEGCRALLTRCSTPRTPRGRGDGWTGVLRPIDFAHVSTTSPTLCRPAARSTAGADLARPVDSVRRCAEGLPDLNPRSQRVGSHDPIFVTGALRIDRGGCGLGQAVQHNNQICR